MNHPGMFGGARSLIFRGWVSSLEMVRTVSRAQDYGAHVWSTFVGDQLPQAATAVVFDKLILDNGSGPKLCTGVILTSDPPQCGTYLLNDFEMEGDWVEDRFGTRLGSRRLTISWPSVDGAVDVVADGPTTILGPDGRFENDFSLPENCAHLDRESASTRRQLQKWASQNPDRDGGLWIAGAAPRNPGIPVLQVKGDAATLDAVREAISTDTRTPCLVAVDFTKSDLARNQNQVSSLFDAGLGIWGSGRGNDGVHVDVDVADRATVEAIIAAVDRPELLRIEGTGAILD